MTSRDQGRLVNAANTLGVPISQAQVELLTRYLDLLESWNRTYNLTSVRNRDGMLVQHLVDCLAVIGPLIRSGLTKSSTPRRRYLDVGSGGGLPGVVIACLCQQVDVVCVDAVRKKVSFVRQVAIELSLSNLTTEHSRIESLQSGRFDVVTSRAFASLADFTELTLAHLAPTGIWMAMKGQTPEAEIAQLPPIVEVFHVEQLQVPELDAARCLVWMRPREVEAIE